MTGTGLSPHFQIIRKNNWCTFSKKTSLYRLFVSKKILHT